MCSCAQEQIDMGGTGEAHRTQSSQQGYGKEKEIKYHFSLLFNERWSANRKYNKCLLGDKINASNADKRNQQLTAQEDWAEKEKGLSNLTKTIVWLLQEKSTRPSGMSQILWTSSIRNPGTAA